ncbi:MAG: hypothetical protein LBU65_08335 [Planctomycetaceae bacterium]|nr:hypothetical protein [Planctomycetaceae bacterium]
MQVWQKSVSLAPTSPDTVTVEVEPTSPPMVIPTEEQILAFREPVICQFVTVSLVADSEQVTSSGGVSPG